MSRYDYEENKKVYVGKIKLNSGNLNPNTTSEQLEGIFAKFGTIATIWVARRPPGFAFVVYSIIT